MINLVQSIQIGRIGATKVNLLIQPFSCQCYVIRRLSYMKKVTKEEYQQAFDKFRLKPISSFSDMDGILPFGYGIPAMDTDWGIEGQDEPIARCEMRKESRHDTEWVYTFYLKDGV